MLLLLLLYSRRTTLACSRFVRLTVMRSSRFYFILLLLLSTSSSFMILPLALLYTRVCVRALFQGVFGEIMERCVSIYIILYSECVLINDDARSFRAVAHRCPLRRSSSPFATGLEVC